MLVQLLHVSEQVEFALWSSFHLSLHLHSPYRKEKKHRLRLELRHFPRTAAVGDTRSVAFS